MQYGPVVVERIPGCHESELAARSRVDHSDMHIK